MPGAPTVMRKWQMHSITPLPNIVESLYAIQESVPAHHRTPCMLRGVFSWAASTIKWSVARFASPAAVATTSLLSEALETTAAARHVNGSLLRPTQRPLTIDCGSSGVSIRAEDASLSSTAAEPAVVENLPLKGVPSSRRVTWSDKVTEGHLPLATICSEIKSVESSDGIDTVTSEPEEQLRTAVITPKTSGSCFAAAMSKLSQLFSAGKPNEAVSVTSDASADEPASQLAEFDSPSSLPPAAVATLDNGHSATDAPRHKTYLCMPGSSNDSKSDTVDDGMRIAAVHGQQRSRTQAAEEEAKPLWKVKVDAKHAHAQKAKETSGETLECRFCVRVQHCNSLELVLPVGFLIHNRHEWDNMLQL